MPPRCLPRRRRRCQPCARRRVVVTLARVGGLGLVIGATVPARADGRLVAARPGGHGPVSIASRPSRAVRPAAARSAASRPARGRLRCDHQRRRPGPRGRPRHPGSRGWPWRDRRHRGPIVPQRGGRLVPARVGRWVVPAGNGCRQARRPSSSARVAAASPGSRPGQSAVVPLPGRVSQGPRPAPVGPISLIRFLRGRRASASGGPACFSSAPGPRGAGPDIRSRPLRGWLFPGRGRLPGPVTLGGAGTGWLVVVFLAEVAEITDEGQRDAPRRGGDLFLLVGFLCLDVGFLLGVGCFLPGVGRFLTGSGRFLAVGGRFLIGGARFLARPPAALAWSAAASRQAKRGPNVPAAAPSPAAPSSARSRGSSSSPADGEPGRRETLGAQALQWSLAADRPCAGSPALEPAPATSSARRSAGLLHRSPPAAGGGGPADAARGGLSGSRSASAASSSFTRSQKSSLGDAG